MQNKYVGDIGDFGKYGLLRALCGFREDDSGERLSLGVVWYLNPDDNKPGGNSTDYLDHPHDRPHWFRRRDPLVFHTLYWIVKADQRDVARIGESEIFPPDTGFVPEGTSRDYVPSQIERRKQWLDRALTKTAACDLVFLDPDNGLVAGENRASIAHVYFDEMARFVERGQSVIVIHHAGRQKDQTVKKQTQTLLDKIRTNIRGAGSTFALRYHRGAPVRVYFVIPAKRDKDILLSRVEQLTQGAWSRHFSVVDPESI